jgi:basic membrane protein A
MAPGKMLTSVLKHVDVAVFGLARATLAQKIPSGAEELGLREDGVGLTSFKYTRKAIGDAAIAKVARLKDAIIAGKIVPPKTREELARFKPVPL